MKKPSRRPLPFAVGIGVVALVSAGIACHPSGHNPVKLKMQEIYQPAFELFALVWNPREFSQPSERTHILQLLNSLSTDFHNVGKASDLRNSDPGNATTLLVTKRLLDDTRRRFEAGDVDYARWRLKGLVHSCVGCHTKTRAATPFIGEAPVSEPANFDSAMNAVEFLIATRQFDEATDRLFRLAAHATTETSLAPRIIPALRMWLLLKVRVKDIPADAAGQLRDLAKVESVPADTKIILNDWANQLAALDVMPAGVSPVDYAEKLLQPVRSNTLLAKDDANLVRTLRASAILHEYLEGDSLPKDNKRRATFLLAMSYQHINISAFAHVRDLYLEECIRDFPGTPEAKEAYSLYEANLKESSSGSGGTHIDENDRKLLEQLRSLS